MIILNVLHHSGNMNNGELEHGFFCIELYYDDYSGRMSSIIWGSGSRFGVWRTLISFTHTRQREYLSATLLRSSSR